MNGGTTDLPDDAMEIADALSELAAGARRLIAGARAGGRSEDLCETLSAIATDVKRMTAQDGHEAVTARELAAFATLALDLLGELSRQVADGLAAAAEHDLDAARAVAVGHVVDLSRQVSDITRRLP